MMNNVYALTDYLILYMHDCIVVHSEGSVIIYDTSMVVAHLYYVHTRSEKSMDFVLLAFRKPLFFHTLYTPPVTKEEGWLSHLIAAKASKC